MQGLIGGIVAAFVGILVGFWLRSASAKAERTQLERRAQELVDELSAARSELTRAQAESAARAGFESLAGERAQTIAQLTVDRDSLNALLAAKNAAEAQALAKVSGLQAELNAERAGLQEKLAMLETATSVKAFSVGKPSPLMVRAARKQLGLASEETTIIGDTMETDIRGAVEAGLQSYLVLTGSTRLESVGDYVYQPTRILESVADLTEEVKTGKASDRLNSPAFGKDGNPARPGNRHQTDVFAFSKPRPAMTK